MWNLIKGFVKKFSPIHWVYQQGAHALTLFSFSVNNKMCVIKLRGEVEFLNVNCSGT